MRWKLSVVLCVILLPFMAFASVNVTVAKPANNSTLTSPVLFTASATSDKNITGWRIYVDGTSVYHTGSANSISTSISMTPGPHQVVVRAWESTGVFGSANLTETVGSSTGPAQGAVTPGSLAFGSVAVNTTSSSQAVKITNTGGATLNVTGVTISPSQFAVSGPSSTSIAPGGSVSYSVTFTPAAATAYSGTLSFTTNSATAVAPVTLSGTGTDPVPSNASCLGTAYYVSNSGNDSDSGISTSSPWKTVAKVVAFEPSLRAGDCVLFQRGGIWPEKLRISNVHGTATNPVTFGNYGSGNLPVLDGGSTRLYGIIDGASDGESASSYITIDGFEVRNATRGGIVFTALAQPGITIQNNYVHHNGYGAYPGACSGCFGTDDGNYGYNEGIVFMGSSSTAFGAKILNNTVSVEGGHNAIMVDKDTGSPMIKGNRVGPGCSHNCIDFKRVTGMVASKNIVNCSTSVTVNGTTYPGCKANALYTEQDDTFTETATYEQNVAYGAASGYPCFGANGATSGLGPIALKYYNNTCYRGSTSANAFNVSSCFGGSLTIENNSFNGGGINLGSCAISSWDYNDKYGTSGGPSGSHDMNVNPLFVNPGSMDFHLQSTSPLLNSGFSTILNVPYIGACGTSGTCP